LAQGDGRSGSHNGSRARFSDSARGFAITWPGLAAGVAVAIAILLNARMALHRFARSVLGKMRSGCPDLRRRHIDCLANSAKSTTGPFGAVNPTRSGSSSSLSWRLVPLATLWSGSSEPVLAFRSLGLRRVSSPALRHRRHGRACCRGTGSTTAGGRRCDFVHGRDHHSDGCGAGRDEYRSPAGRCRSACLCWRRSRFLCIAFAFLVWRQNSGAWTSGDERSMHGRQLVSRQFSR